MLKEIRCALIASLGGKNLIYQEAVSHSGGCVLCDTNAAKIAWLFAPNAAYAPFQQKSINSNHDYLDLVSQLETDTLITTHKNPTIIALHDYLYAYDPETTRPRFLHVRAMTGNKLGVVHHTPHPFQGGLVPGHGDTALFINARTLKIDHTIYKKWTGTPLPSV